MANWDATAATVKRLIDKNGRTVVLYKQGNVPQDVDKPWRGQADYPEGSVTGKAVFIPPGSGLGHSVDNEQNVKRAEQVAYFAAADDTGEELEGFDQIRDGTTLWKILHSQVLNPAGTRLLYQFEVAR